MAKKLKKGFIPIKHKDYPKYFSDKNLDKIWSFFRFHFDEVKGMKIDWEETYYTDMIKGYANIPLYPETDTWDDSEGIQPKQLSKIIDLIGFEGFKKLSKILSKNISMFVNNDNYFYTEGETRETTIISWKEVIKEIIMPKIKERDIIYFGKLFFCDELGITRMATTYTKAQFPYDIDDDIFESIVIDNLEIEKILFFQTNKIYDTSEKLNLSNLNADEFFDKRKQMWQDIHGFIPKNKGLMLLEPKYWNKKVFLESLFRIYKTRNFNGLNNEDQNNFIGFYKSFGSLLAYVAPMINNEKITKPGSLWPILYRSDVPDGLKKILSNLQRGIDIRLKVADILYIYKGMSTFKDANEFILARNRISIDDVNQLIEVGTMLSNMSKSDLENVKDIPWRHIGVFKKYNVNNTKSILDLYAKTKDIKTTIPLVSGKVGQYTYSVLDKDDIRGLVAGNATNCCQHIPSGIGKSCVYYGAEHKDSTFFIITDRAGSIVCQSWLWTDKDIMVCDSAEAVRSDELFYEAYVRMAEEVVNQSDTIRAVHIGSKGRAFQHVLPNAERTASIPSVPSNSKFDYGRNGNVYSDANHQQVLFKK